MRVLGGTSVQSFVCEFTADMRPEDACGVYLLPSEPGASPVLAPNQGHFHLVPAASRRYWSRGACFWRGRSVDTGEGLCFVHTAEDTPTRTVPETA